MSNNEGRNVTATSKPATRKSASKTPAKTALVLRTCNADMTSHNGFHWPESGPVECPDWEPTKKCGNGLHGLLWGEGDASLVSGAEDAKWVVVAVNEADCIDLGDKVKFPRGEVVLCGTREDATAYIIANGGRGRKVNWSTLTGGYRSKLTGGDGSKLTGGDESTLTGGNGSTLTGGYRSKLTGGYWSKLTGGDGSTLTGGNWSTLTGGYRSKLTGGNWSTLTGGYRSTLTGGNGSKLTGGDGSKLTGGNGSKLTGGDGSKLTGGDESVLVIKRWNGKRYRWEVANVGEDGIEPGVPYRLDDNGNFVRADGK